MRVPLLEAQSVFQTVSQDLTLIHLYILKFSYETLTVLAVGTTNDMAVLDTLHMPLNVKHLNKLAKYI